MLEQFPLRQVADDLASVDFRRVAAAFGGILAARIPTAGRVIFPHSPTDLPSVDLAGRSRLQAAWQEICQGDKAGLFAGNALFLRFPCQGGGMQLAFIQHLDELLVKRASADWLVDIRDEISGDLLSWKKSFQDVETRLGNSTYLLSQLANQARETGSGQLVLIELPPRRKSARDAFRQSRKAAAALAAFCEHRFTIYHLGQCLFALHSPTTDQPPLSRFTAALVNHLKNEGFFRVYLGSSTILAEHNGNDCGSLLNEAWTALQEGRKRGPFGFCDYAFLRHPEHHPLHSLPAAVRHKLLRLSTGEHCFSLVEIQPGALTEEQFRSWFAETGQPGQILAAGSLFLYLPGQTGEAACALMKPILDRARQQCSEPEVYAGISTFPSDDSSRAEVVKNCRKALLHAAFFGSGGLALFDAVSLNVSGDIYFSDGDLPKAVREYRAGLQRQPKDVNLLNSLGVTYALLNRNSSAQKCFAEALQVEPENYMALYNLGLQARLRGDYPAAISHFVKLAEAPPISPDEQQVAGELKLLLGKLYCRTAQFSKALSSLQDWQQVNPTAGEHPGFLRYLGEALSGCGRNREAMACLQRSLHHNGNDSEALSLLAMAILAENEGDDIALSFCRKSVELEPSSPLLRLRLAQAEFRTGAYDLALANCRRCQRRAEYQGQVQILTARIYGRLGRLDRARYWLNKTLQQGDADQALYKEAADLAQSFPILGA